MTTTEICCNNCYYRDVDLCDLPCAVCKHGGSGNIDGFISADDIRCADLRADLSYDDIPANPPENGYKILDSGERREFSSGAVRDMAFGKGRMDLLPWDAIIEVSKHCEAGALKYGEHNVDNGLPLHSFCDSGARHLAKFIAGHDDENHLIAACWNLLWAVEMVLKHPELCDVPWRSE